MLDEPVAGMSPAEREQTAELLKRICANRSILIIEHDMEFVQRIAHKVTVLHLGKAARRREHGRHSEQRTRPGSLSRPLTHYLICLKSKNSMSATAKAK